MSFVTLGVVSNAWAELLPESSLEEQCRRAEAMGFRYVELRQRALGACEEAVAGDGRPWPVPEALAQLRRSLPGLGLNLAVEAPFLTKRVSGHQAYMQRCFEAAVALGGKPPVLRLVDVSPAPTLLDHEEATDELGQALGDLAVHASAEGVRLALENSKQPVGALQAVLRRAGFVFPSGMLAPQICWDAHNQITQKLRPEDPVEFARTVPVEELFEFHFKQGEGGQLLPDVRDGEIDWRAILAALRERGYRGPALFELPPGPDIWERLGTSAAYISGLLAEVEGRS